MVHQMIRAGLAHFVAHTNADVAAHGVSEALAQRLALSNCRPLEPDVAPGLDQLTVFVPPPAVDGLLTALAEAGAGAVGDYSECSFVVDGIGRFRPLSGANPAIGEVGVLSRIPEARVSMVLPRSRRSAVLAAMRAQHPYEEVAYELCEQPPHAGSTGTGRIGVLAQPMTLREFTGYVATRLPRTVWGVRAAGPPDQLISTVAVCGGSGAGYAELARQAGADAYLTADLKHHSTIEAVAEQEGISTSPLALVDAAHWATEAPWLDTVAGKLNEEFGDLLKLRVSTLVTDPWTLHMP